jgi:hypothetical protein
MAAIATAPEKLYDKAQGLRRSGGGHPRER